MSYPFFATYNNFIFNRSELHAIMTGGFATVAGTVLAAFRVGWALPGLCLSPESALYSQVTSEKGQEVQILAISHWKSGYFGQCFGFVWLPGGTRAICWCQVVPGSTRVLPGGCRVVIAQKINVLKSLGKVVFGPLMPSGGFGGSSPHSRPYLVPWCLEGGWGTLPHSRDKIGHLE